MDKLFFPAIFHQAQEGGFWVSFPDFPECFTDGEDISQTYENATDALGLAITSGKNEGTKIPSPSSIEDIDVGDGVIVIVEFDWLAYQKKHNAKAVKKTLSIPEWLNTEALDAGINFSQVLQEGLLARLELK